MKKNISKMVAGTVIMSTVVTSSTVKVNACDSAAIMQTANEVSIMCPYIAPIAIGTGLVITGITTVIGIRADKTTNDDVLYRSYTRLPDHWRPNSVVEKINPQGKCIQRRFYDEKGNPLFDVDLNNHGMPEAHPFGHGGAHKHIYNNKIRNVNKRRQKGVELSDEEYRKYVKEFNRDTADKMKVRWIED